MNAICNLFHVNYYICETELQYQNGRNIHCLGVLRIDIFEPNSEEN